MSAKRRRILKRAALGAAALLLISLVFVAVLAARMHARLTQTEPAPESATGLRTVEPVSAKQSLVVAAHPEAARIGSDVLRAGGSALDAAIAVQLALTLVEPQSSGIGGGAFLLYWDAESKQLHAYDGRETAPAAATPALFLDAEGEPLSFPEALVGGRSVGTPGVVRMLAMAHERHGKRAWRDLFEGPVALADRGFAVTPRLHALLALDPVLPTLRASRDHFYDAARRPHAPGTILPNEPLAAVFRTLRDNGADAFYEGPIAEAMVAAVGAAKQPSIARGVLNLARGELGMAPTGDADILAPGTLALSDLEGYRAVERKPLCRNHRKFRVCGFPPPTSGGVAVLQTLALLELSDPVDASSAAGVHLLVEAQRLAYADRDRHVGDPDFVSVPVEGLLNDGYVRERASLIAPGVARANPEAGTPPGAEQGYVTAPAAEYASTSHFVVVDQRGSIACMTSSIEMGFGAHVFVNGFLLNNQLTDFSFRPEKDGRKVANAVAPGKRPRSSMSPIIVFDRESGAPVVALGSPGGSRIIGYVTQTLVALLDGGMPVQEAVRLPHVLGRDAKTEVEDVGWNGGSRDALVSQLEAWGHEVSVGQQNSGLHAVQITANGLVAGIDPRREGSAVGD